MIEFIGREETVNRFKELAEKIKRSNTV